MEFKEFNNQIKAQFAGMCETGKLFKSNVTGQQVWETYLSSFENEGIFRDPESSEHNCNCCKNFIRRYGNILAIDANGELMSIFTGVTDVGEYSEPSKACALLLDASQIQDVFFESYEMLKELKYQRDSLGVQMPIDENQHSYELGVKFNHKEYTQEEADKFGAVEKGRVYQFDHFQIDLPKQFVHFGSESLATITSEHKVAKEMLYKIITSIHLDTFKTVKDLFVAGSFLNGDAYLHIINKFIELANPLYDEIANQLVLDGLNEWCWKTIFVIPDYIKFFNGTQLHASCEDLSIGKDINVVWKEWNKREDPTNKHRPTAPITQRQIVEAQIFVEENGYTESFNRRFATIDDISIEEIKHVNNGDGKIKTASIFDNVKSTSTRHKRAEFDKLEEVSIDKFMKDILPSCTSIEAYLENRMQGNLCALTTSLESSKSIFKWSNPFSWTFNGNLAGKSQIKDAVKSRGGKTEADIRISLAFPNTTDDYDLHVLDSDGKHISYNNVRILQPSSGMLDLDAQGIDGEQPPEKRVENVTFSNKSQIKNGDLDIWVENYSGNNIHASFDIEIEIEGEIVLLTSTTSKRNKMDVGHIAFKDGHCEIHPNINMSLKESKSISKELWNLETNNFHKVNLACLSPNHWGSNQAGNKHFMFMLEGCKAEGSTRSFHNENLIPELLKHKKVMEVLGATNMIEPEGKHLAGLGFNSTVKDELIVRCKGNFNRLIKIKF